MIDAKEMSSFDAAVVGGGLAGLTAAVYLARAGRRTVLFEKGRLGGRGATETKQGAMLNMGPHALYLSGPGKAVLNDIGVTVAGGKPNTRGTAIADSGLHLLPDGAASLLRTSLLSFAGKLEAAKLLSSFGSIDASSLRHLSLSEWTDRTVRNEGVQKLMLALFRLTTYANDPHLLSAESAVTQLQRAIKGGTLYADGGWQTIVDALRNEALKAGALILQGKKVSRIEHDPQGAHLIHADDAERYKVRSVIIASGPDDAFKLVDHASGTSLRSWRETSVPIRAACLDLVVRKLPRPEVRFALGIDRPLYFSNHSSVAALSVNGTMVLHAMKYHSANENVDAETDRAELEAMLDKLQPGWREETVYRRFLPSMTVSHRLYTVEDAMNGRPGPEVPEIEGLYVAGDWVGNEGILADAALSSGRAAALAAIRQSGGLYKKAVI
ncbi:phytoene desaturase family protein [Paenibacillus thermotolerans]|uniref:phytoene desaturase family protein n=1 Tax=Paenibacillus thermotolerans TaxID=3027807 RepID=UPI002368C620|nr:MULTISPECIES: FAD-dependent oxidoreductase [unclassified Paenibacillus]